MNPEKCCHRGHPNCVLSPRLLSQRDVDRKEPCWGSQHIRPYGQDSLLEILSHAAVSKALLLLGTACSTAIGKVLSELGRKLLGSSAGNNTHADSPGLVCNLFSLSERCPKPYYAQSLSPHQPKPPGRLQRMRSCSVLVTSDLRGKAGLATGPPPHGWHEVSGACSLQTKQIYLCYLLKETL